MMISDSFLVMNMIVSSEMLTYKLDCYKCMICDQLSSCLVIIKPFLFFTLNKYINRQNI